MQLAYKTIPITVKTRTEQISIGAAIYSTDTGAYVLEITWADVAQITGTVNLRFERGSLSWDKAAADGVVQAGNKVTYTLDQTLYAAAGLICYVQFITGDVMYSPLKLTFDNITVIPS